MKLTITLAALLAITIVPATGAGGTCTFTTSEATVRIIETPMTHETYLMYDVRHGGGIYPFAAFVYFERNGKEGLQRNDVLHSDTCGIAGLADELIL